MTKITYIQLEIPIIAYELSTAWNVYAVSLRIQSECGKIQNRKKSAFGHFSRSVRMFVEEINCPAAIALYNCKCKSNNLFIQKSRIPTQLNSDTENDESVKNCKRINGKKDSRMISKAVILTAISSGISICVYFVMAFPLSTVISYEMNRVDNIT